MLVAFLCLDTDSHLIPGRGLASLNIETFRKNFQITPDNEIIGDESRVSLLNSVGQSLLNLPEIFGASGRPGKLVGMCQCPVLSCS